MSVGERQTLMGHANAGMTARYTKTPTENARQAVEKMGQVAGRKKPPTRGGACVILST
jgi:hypothetical protein